MTRHVGVGLLMLALVVAACGSSDESTTPSSAESIVSTTPRITVAPPPAQPVTMPARLASSADPSLAADSTSSLGTELFSAAEAGDRNLVLSPLSIGIALAMLQPGASGEAVAQFADLLDIDDPTQWHASMNALVADLGDRTADDEFAWAAEEDNFDPGEFELAIANGAFLQPGYPFRDDYLGVVGTNYDAAIEELDFAADQAAAAARLNEFVEAATNGRIADLVTPDDIDPDAVLALVNALHLRASWQQTFRADATTDHDFTLLDGTEISVPLMNGRGDRSGEGDGWVAASKLLVGGLRLDVVVPDRGRFDETAAQIGDVFEKVDVMPNPAGALSLPRFEVRVDLSLDDVLQSAGLTAPYDLGNLLGVADDPRLVLDKSLHQTWIAVDEDGIEAAAATIVLVVPASRPVEEPIPVVADRPFFLRIADVRSGATLFLGQITDPTA